MSVTLLERDGGHQELSAFDQGLLIAVEDLRRQFPEGDYTLGEALAAFAQQEDPDSYAELDVDGANMKSWRIRTPRPVEGPDSGGIRFDGEVDKGEVTTLSKMMKIKAILHDLTGAAKGGVAVEYRDGFFYPIGESEPLNDAQVRLMCAKHAQAHNYNPMSNVGATDLNTQPRHMGYMIDGLKKKLGNMAYACFTGAPSTHSEWSDFRDVATGKGGALATEEYVRWNPKLRERINAGETLDVTAQGVGKAGWPYIDNMPNGLGLRAVSDAHGGVRAQPGYHLDPAQVRQWVLKNGLSKEIAGELPEGVEWIEKHELWDTPADIVVPAFRENQIDGPIAEKLINNGTSLIVELANHPLTPEAEALFLLAGIDVLFGELANGGGRSGSHWEWANQLNKYQGIRVEADLESYQHHWEQRFRSVVTRSLRVAAAARKVAKADANGDESAANVITLRRSSNTMVVKRAIDELRAVA